MSKYFGFEAAENCHLDKFEYTEYLGRLQIVGKQSAKGQVLLDSIDALPVKEELKELHNKGHLQGHRNSQVAVVLAEQDAFGLLDE